MHVPPYEQICNKGCHWNRMILDPSDELWEISKNLGTLYVATSRGKTLGSKDQAYPTDSAIYWTGNSVSTNRIKNCKRKQNGQLCESYKKRAKWVEYLEGKAEETKTRYSKRKLEEITKTTYAAAMKGDFIKDRTDLTARITDIITNPNKKWKEAKRDHEIPSDYFAASASGDL
mmetsp:Transcript_15032/g.21352  ORF Transcript_15032/g.21352 Transcript_15032/m.21352 type:complete len:174 (-) Transcript_15032:202-723(-)